MPWTRSGAVTTGDVAVMLERPVQDWPVSLVSHDERRPGLVLRALRQADRSEWDRVRNANLHYVGQWEPTAPDGVGRRVTFRQYVKSLDREARAGRIVPFLIEADGRIAGQMHLFGIVHGSLLSARRGTGLPRSMRVMASPPGHWRCCATTPLGH